MESQVSKGPKKGRKPKGKQVDDLSHQMGSMKVGGSGDSTSLSLFPARPPRTTKPPGTPVKLWVNLFKMSLVHNKPIYRYTVNTEIERDDSKVEKPEEEKGAKKNPEPSVQKKLGRDILRAAVDEAIKTWIEESKPQRQSSARLEFHYVYDNTAANVYALFDMFAKPAMGPSQEFRVKLQLDTYKDSTIVKEPKYFRVKIFKGTQMDMSRLFDFCTMKPQSSDIKLVLEHLRTLNVILRGRLQTMPCNVMTPTSVFPFLEDNQTKLNPNVLLNKGFFMSARPSEGGLVLNVANTVAAFHEEVDLVDLLKMFDRRLDLTKTVSKDLIDKVKKEILNKQIEARHKNYGSKDRPHYRKYRVQDITGSSLDKFTLVDKNTRTTKEVTIADYFFMEYKVKLKFPKLPCVVDKGRKLPIEVCHLIDKQRVMRKMTPEETSEIIKQAAVKPEVYFQRLKKNVQNIQENSQPLNNFGMKFEVNPVEVEGRELAPLLLTAGNKKEIKPNDGQYRVDSEKFFLPAIVNKWGLLFLRNRSLENCFRDPNHMLASASRFSQLYCLAGQRKGVSVGPLDKSNVTCLELHIDENKMKTVLKQYFKGINDSKLDHVIIVLPEGCPDWIYRYVQFLEVSPQVGRKSNEKWTRVSCLKLKNFMVKIINSKDEGKMFISNLWLKYNTKLGGINFVLKEDRTRPFLQDGYLFVSVDVCHPAPGDKLIQSVAAVVGMWDLTNNNFSYCTRMRVQKKVRKDNSTIEEVGELGDMVGEVLDSYLARKKKYPANIMILRDGVSEGQFKIVLESELGKVHQKVSNKYNLVKQALPKISCLVVQKRHRVRFIRQQPKQGFKGPDFNIQPGTVVDSTIVHPIDFSFYIAPHKAIQGTSRAAHIYVISNDIKLSQDQAQEMVHALSYLSPRCTKSTSIPTPVNLADLAAERGKNIVISWNDDNRIKLTEDERLSKLNAFLSNLADSNYKNTLFYI